MVDAEGQIAEVSRFVTIWFSGQQSATLLAGALVIVSWPEAITASNWECGTYLEPLWQPALDNNGC